MSLVGWRYFFFQTVACFTYLNSNIEGVNIFVNDFQKIISTVLILAKSTKRGIENLFKYRQ